MQQCAETFEWDEVKVPGLFMDFALIFLHTRAALEETTKTLGHSILPTHR